jgi:hypothetical protein
MLSTTDSRLRQAAGLDALQAWQVWQPEGPAKRIDEQEAQTQGRALQGNHPRRDPSFADKESLL